MQKRSFLRLGLGCASLVATAAVRAEPAAGLVVPFAPGGLADSLARLLAQELTSQHNMRIRVINRPGAAGLIAAREVADSQPGDRLFLMATTSLLLQSLRGQTEARSLVRDRLKPHLLLGHQDSFLVVAARSKVRSVDDLSRLAASRGHPLNLASLGVGSMGHLLGMSLSDQTRTAMNHVPYNSSPAILRDMIAGDIDLAFMAYENFRAYLAEERVTPILVASRESAEVLPAVPPASALGIPGIDRGSWFLLAGSSADPDPTFSRSLVHRCNAVVASKAISETLTSMGVRGIPLRDEALKTFLDSERNYWSDRIAGLAGIGAV
jgi:tripartite-type tricarboxylate transporter receptor subunit TctC